jgi:hypothetical protein
MRSVPAEIRLSVLLISRCPAEAQGAGAWTTDVSPFDYTKWRQGLDEDLSIEQISRKAMVLRNKKD